MRTEKAVQEFLSSKRAKGLSPKTTYWYETILARFASVCPKLPSKPEIVESFLVSCPGGDERRHGYYRTLRALYNFMEKRRQHKNPIRFIDPPRRRHKEPRNLSVGELGLLLSYPHEPRIKAALLFLADTGARLGELYNVCPSDFKKTPDGYVVTICGKTGQRTVPVCLATYLSLKDQLPFPYQLHRLGEKLSMAFKSVGVRGTAHSLRHTFATLWDGDELVLQRITGHAHLETLKIYRHLRMPALCEQHKKHGPLRRALARKLPKGML